ncbi:MAG: diguanylate cyclase [Burkholderiales bacterium]
MELLDRRGFVVEHFAPFTAVAISLRNFAVPLLLWWLAILLAGYAVFPDLLSGLKVHGPYFVFLTGIWLSLAFRQGRAFFVLLTLAFGYLAHLLLRGQGTPQITAEAVYAAVCVFIPLNIAVYSLLRDRGALNAAGLRRMSLPLLEMGAIAAFLTFDATGLTAALYSSFYTHAALAGVHIPQLGIVCMIAAVIVGVVCAVARRSVIDAAFATAVTLFALACIDPPPGEAYSWFCSMAGAIVAIAVVQHSYRMAFYDELTGLAGRRALNERMESLDSHFTVAMIDIDHFKSVNDTWGHKVGDQVLKLVAARLQRVRGGGKVYRYGGEEFTILFPGKRAISLKYQLEALRKDIETYKLGLRESGPRTVAPGSAPPDEEVPKSISVTISIGVAERTNRFELAERALKVADKALYRAKTEGRNRIVGPG